MTSEHSVSSRPDRRVHARYGRMEIVRYDRAGKWYLEPVDEPSLKRQHVTIREAADAALWGLTNYHGEVTLGLPGGRAFDRMVEAG